MQLADQGLIKGGMYPLRFGRSQKTAPYYQIVTNLIRNEPDSRSAHRQCMIGYDGTLVWVVTCGRAIESKRLFSPKPTSNWLGLEAFFGKSETLELILTNYHIRLAR